MRSAGCPQTSRPHYPNGTHYPNDPHGRYALGGLYSDLEICGAVATAICMQDPTFHTCRAFLLRLSEAFHTKHTTITAGGSSDAMLTFRSESMTTRMMKAIFGSGGNGSTTPRGDGSTTPRGNGSTTPRGDRSSVGNTTPRGDRSSVGNTTPRTKSPVSLSFSRSSSISRGGQGDQPEIEGLADWPGRTFTSTIDETLFGAIVECWLTKMAKGSRSRGGGSAASATSATSTAAATSTGVLSDTMAQLMQPPHLERLQDKLALAPILKALLERHFEVNKVIAAAYRCVPLRCRCLPLRCRCGAAAYHSSSYRSHRIPDEYSDF